MWFRNELSSLAEVSLYLKRHFGLWGQYPICVCVCVCVCVCLSHFERICRIRRNMTSTLWHSGSRSTLFSNFPLSQGLLIIGGFTKILRNITLGRTPLEDWSKRHRDLCLTTNNTRRRQTFITPVIFEPAIPPSERPQNHALDRAATGLVSTLSVPYFKGMCWLKEKLGHITDFYKDIQ
jgi:hypothetical protein